MSYQLPSGRWRGMFRRVGQTQVTQVFDTEEEARRWERQRNVELANRTLKASGSPKLHAAIRGYLASGDFQEKAPGTRNREACAAQSILYLEPMASGLSKAERQRRLMAPDPSSEPDRRRRPWADRDVDVFDGLDMADYISERRMETCVRHPDRKVSPDSVRLEVRFLSCVFKFAVQRRYRPTNPALARLHGFKIPSPNRRETRITPEQEKSLVVTAYSAVADSNRTNPALFPWLDLLRTTGCRPGEAAKIELAWVNLDKKCIDVPRRGTKKRTPRRVLLDDRLCQVVGATMARAEVAGSKYLFYSVSREGHCVPYRYGSAWARLRRVTGVAAEAHGWRREVISRLFEDSALTDGQIALLVGDLNVASLEPYKFLRSEKLRDAFQEHMQMQTKATEDAHAAAVRGAIEMLKSLGVVLSEEELKKIPAAQPLAAMIDPAEGRVHLPARKHRADAA